MSERLKPSAVRGPMQATVKALVTRDGGSGSLLSGSLLSGSHTPVEVTSASTGAPEMEVEASDPGQNGTLPASGAQAVTWKGNFIISLVLRANAAAASLPSDNTREQCPRMPGESHIRKREHPTAAVGRLTATLPRTAHMRLGFGRGGRGGLAMRGARARARGRTGALRRWARVRWEATEHCAFAPDQRELPAAPALTRIGEEGAAALGLPSQIPRVWRVNGRSNKDPAIRASPACRAYRTRPAVLRAPHRANARALLSNREAREALLEWRMRPSARERRVRARSRDVESARVKSRPFVSSRIAADALTACVPRFLLRGSNTCAASVYRVAGGCAA
ncbi:hypothetical protein DFH09DRAFT_1075492 [Mycena vulgaris]|nr:hypothetical protein DFH09DRAFT_1075492 [Mycena vulgaris]